MGDFSIRTETDGFTGVSGGGPDQKKEIGAQFGFIFPRVTWCLPGIGIYMGLLLARELDLVAHVLHPPLAKRVEDWHQGPAILRERVFHLRWNHRVDLPCDEPSLLQFPEFLGQHPLCDLRLNLVHDLTESQGPVLERVNDKGFPFNERTVERDDPLVPPGAEVNR